MIIFIFNRLQSLFYHVVYHTSFKYKFHTIYLYAIQKYKSLGTPSYLTISGSTITLKPIAHADVTTDKVVTVEIYPASYSTHKVT